MLRSCLRPSPLGFLLGIAVIALWALLWAWFLFSVVHGETAAAQKARLTPELVQLHGRVAKSA